MSSDTSKPEASIVGARLSWTCAVCRATKNTYQLTRADSPQEITLPPGWRLLDGALTVCAAHEGAV